MACNGKTEARNSLVSWHLLFQVQSQTTVAVAQPSEVVVQPLNQVVSLIMHRMHPKSAEVLHAVPSIFTHINTENALAVGHCGLCRGLCPLFKRSFPSLYLSPGKTFDI